MKERAFTLKTTASIFAFALAGSLAVVAQGTFLSTGDSLVLGFYGVDHCALTESAPVIGGIVSVYFGNDVLAPNESLKLEMFENNFDEVPTASQIFSPSTPLTFVRLMDSGIWFDYQGVVRVKMLNGSVDVSSAGFGVWPSATMMCWTTIAVPEPNSLALTLLAVAFFATGLRACRNSSHRRTIPAFFGGW